MLSNPVLGESAVNLEAVDLIQFNPHAYKQMVLDCVAASQRLEGNLIIRINTSVVFLVKCISLFELYDI